MSSLRTKAVVAIFTIVALTFGPYTALAQNSWTPPTQAPTGGNVPAPVNIGASNQAKTGGLSIQGTLQSLSLSRLAGSTILQPDANDAGFLVNFLKGYNYNDVFFGDSNSFNLAGTITPVDLSVYGRLRYEQADTNGDPVPPVAGYVLVTDAQGFASWVDPATLPGGGGGNDPRLPSGTQQGDTLYWDTTVTPNKWKVASNVKINPNSAVIFQAMPGTDGLKVLNDGTTISNHLLSVGGALKVSLDNSVDPEPGSVLKLLDNAGNVSWGDAITDGDNNGDVLTWNSTTNEWESTTINIGTGNLPASATIGDTLRWDGTIWDKTSMWQVGTQGQPTTVGTNQLTTTGVKLSTTFDSASFITLASPNIRLFTTGDVPAPGDILTAVDSVGKISWSDPSFLTSIIMPPGTDNFTMRYNEDANSGAGGWEQTNQITIDDDDDNIWLGAGAATGDVYIANGETAKGRFLNSADDNGMVNWNKYFVYNDIAYVDNGNDLNIDSVEILESDEATRTSGFANFGEYTYLQNRLEVDGLTFLNNDTTINGLTMLNGDATISTDGDLFLKGIETAPAQQPGPGGQQVSVQIKDLCIRMTDKKVVLCETTVKPPVVTIGQFTQRFFPGTESIPFPRPDQAPGPVTVKACSGGGGGGGGGQGIEIGGSDPLGYGGGAGGGGGKGTCSTSTITTSAGTELITQIGGGGTGGNAGQLDMQLIPVESTITDTTASSGQNGGDTTVEFQGNTLAVLPGGHSGYAGANASGNSPYGWGSAGTGGSTDFAISTSSWHMGENGFLPNQPGGANNTAFGFGGRGGHGEDNATGQGGYGGSRGDPGNQYGGDGGLGAPSYGGGGGGGGAGKWYHYMNPSLPSNGQDNSIRNHGGWGGNGGTGYVDLTYNVYIEEPAAVTEMVYDSSGTFNKADLPAGVTQINVEVWGAGAGGRGVPAAPSQGNVSLGAGGGAGAYAVATFSVSSLPAAVSVTVGNGGNGGTAGSPNGTNGTQSSFGSLISAGGGLASTGTAGGLGSTATSGTGSPVSGGNGGNGGQWSGTAPIGAGGGGVQSVDGAGDGGGGGYRQWPSSGSGNGVGGSDGRVFISW